tara:strand:- start:784 stop:1131 length:348 start_codon:yes stop_codon:yes gene_type:complete
MGYRSSVHLGINNSAVEDWLTHLATNPKAFEIANHEGCMHKTKDGLYLNWEYVKWYDGYPEVDQVEAFLSFLEDNDREGEFSFFRLGEEFGDGETRGHSDSFEFYPVQSVEVCFE